MSLIDFEKKLAQDIQKSGLLTRSLGEKVAFDKCILHLEKDKVIGKLLQDYNCCERQGRQGKPCLNGSVHPFDWHLFKAIEFAFLGDDTEEVDKVMARGGGGEDKFFDKKKNKYVQKHGYSSKHLFEWWNKYMRVGNAEKNKRWILNVKLCDGTGEAADTEEEVQTSEQVVVTANVPDAVFVHIKTVAYTSNTASGKHFKKRPKLL